jgi:hypothetical protein
MVKRSEQETSGFVAECFWPDVRTEDLRALDEAAGAATAALRAAGKSVRYLGSLLINEDEVVLCQFDGTSETVHAAAERAGIPFERILETHRSPWPQPSGNDPRETRAL